MLVLVLDTSCAVVTAGLVDGEVVVAQRATHNPRGHGELLAPSIAACLAQAGAAPADLGAVVAGLGPGPFTGLRVGLVTAAAFGDALRIPVYGVCSLDALAAGTHGSVLVLTDARRKEVYWATYADGVRIAGPCVDRPVDVPRHDGVVVGPGALLDPDRWPHVRGPQAPGVSELVALAAGRIASGAPGEALAPLYLRRPDAVESGVPKRVTP